MKNIYFLRHGQTQFNKTWRHQFPVTSLSEEGKVQARAIAEKLKSVDFDVIISSPYARTKETAQCVAEATGKPIEYSDLFVELRRPRELWGVSWYSLKTVWIMGMLYFMAGKENWHYSDGESKEEFQARTLQALEYLTSRKENNILLVTHRGLMENMFNTISKKKTNLTTQYRSMLWKNLKIGNCCYFETTWSPEGENGATLKGTWAIKEGFTCP
jgi:broad specificity phosphatase PhoE